MKAWPDSLVCFTPDYLRTRRRLTEVARRILNATRPRIWEDRRGCRECASPIPLPLPDFSRARLAVLAALATLR